MFYSGEYTEKEVSDVADKIKATFFIETKYKAVFKKYSSKKFMKASLFVAEWILTQEKPAGFKTEAPIEHTYSDDDNEAQDEEESD